MNRATIAVFIVASLLSPYAAAQSPFEVRESQSSGVDFYTTNYGIFGHHVARGDGGFYYPRGADSNTYLFGSGLWFGATKLVDDTVRRLSIMSYNPGSGKSGFVPGEWTRDSNPPLPTGDHLAYSPHYDNGNGSYLGEGLPSWPLWQSGSLEPTFYDPGIYVGEASSRTPAISGTPAFVPGAAEQFFSRYHDGDLSRYERNETAVGFPIGLQVEQNVYGFRQPGLDATVILHYRVINVSDDTLRDCVIGGLFDADVGHPSNDRASFYTARPELQTAYISSRRNTLETRDTGTLLITMLESPAVDLLPGSPSFGFVRHDKRHYETTEQTGVATFQNFVSDDAPASPADRYYFMAASERDGDMGEGDRIMLLASGRFNLAPGDTARMAIGLTVLPDSHLPKPVTHPIEIAVERLIGHYRHEPVSSVGAPSFSSGGLSVESIHPNPATGVTSIDIHLARRSDVRLQLVDALGRAVLTRESVMENGDHRLSLDLGGVAPGVYMISIEAGGEREIQRVIVSH